MLGIKAASYYLPTRRISNFDRQKMFGIDQHFIEKKIGISSVAVRGRDEESSDLCIKAFEKLQSEMALDLSKIEAILVVTQNPDFQIPHTAAVVHGKLGLPSSCATFDISTGCSGYVYGLSAATSFAESNGFRSILLFTADPYSKIVDPADKNTSLLFGDAGTVTWIGESPLYTLGKFRFGTQGERFQTIQVLNGKLTMKGSEVYKFVCSTIPGEVSKCLKQAGLSLSEVDKILCHQGSRFMVESLAERLNVSNEKMPFLAGEYGNTVSSSIPIMLCEEIKKPSNRSVVVCGFGTGLSWGIGILHRATENV